ncbi:MAG: hypothetical protein KKB37_09480, partial [Alphaproteobacteria bacterium]|nr:hypothetical protein [Alphaproteobacteria bacterium]
MTTTSRRANENLEAFMSEVTEYGTRNAEGPAGHRGRDGGSRLSALGAGLATLVSIIALVFSA